MEWIPPWLADVYSTVYLRFGSHEFSTSEARSLTELSQARVNLSLSRLASSGWLMRSNRGKYYALDPIVVILALKGNWYARVKGRGFAPCLMRALGEIFAQYGERLLSLALFGSCARREERKTSDIDLLAVADGLSERYSERLAELRRVVASCSRIFGRQWQASGEHHPLDIVVVSPEELRGNELFLLDLTHDAVLIRDKNGLLQKRLLELREKLERTGALRIETTSGRYWDLRAGGAAKTN